MRSLKGIAMLIIANVLIFTALAVSGTLIIQFLLPAFGIDLRGSMHAMDFAWSLVFGFGGAFISLFLSKFMVKRSMQMQQVIEPVTAKEKIVFHTVAELAQRDGLRMPEVWVYWDDNPNAFATGATRNHSMIAVSSGLAMSLSDDELRAVVAHEMGHVSNGDMITSTLLQGLMNTFVYFLAKLISRPIMERNYWLGFFVYMGVQFMLSILAMIPVCWFSRRREFAADAYAAQAVGAAPMQRALRRIESLTQLRDDSVGEDALATMKISNEHKSMSELFSTHPSMDARIEALSRFAAKH